MNEKISDTDTELRERLAQRERSFDLLAGAAEIWRAQAASQATPAGGDDYERGRRAGQVEGVTFASWNIARATHHCHWLYVVGYRGDPLDQTLVNHVLESAADSLKWWTNNPDKLASCIADRAARAAQREDAVAIKMTEAEAKLAAGPLWCCHVRGPDDVHPTKNYEDALKMADGINDAMKRLYEKDPSPNNPIISAVPAPWPWSAVSHAEGLKAKVED